MAYIQDDSDPFDDYWREFHEYDVPVDEMTRLQKRLPEVDDDEISGL